MNLENLNFCEDLKAFEEIEEMVLQVVEESKDPRTLLSFGKQGERAKEVARYFQSEYGIDCIIGQEKGYNYVVVNNFRRFENA